MGVYVGYSTYNYDISAKHTGGGIIENYQYNIKQSGLVTGLKVGGIVSFGVIKLNLELKQINQIFF